MTIGQETLKRFEFKELGDNSRTLGAEMESRSVEHLEMEDLMTTQGSSHSP